MATDTVTPEVLWAQRSSKDDAEKNFIYLTIRVPDVPKENLKLELKPTSLSFTGHSDTLKKTYHVDLEFYAEIDPENSKVHHTARDVEMKLRKKELNESYWPRLLKDTKKAHFLKTDFDKWVDEDEQNEAGDDDFNFGNMGNDFGGLDFSNLGGSSSKDEDEDESDDDMPPLEGEDEEEEKKDGEKDGEKKEEPKVAEEMTTDAKEVVVS
ncbi:putative Co-chaperone protein [Thermochaetoides thermophila DSM 1495]|uniref:Putative Co-chaperone protein n=1 Tax=Chaetomium thermophilum (strain DSM 1495 / CBS 144.50 / IMI 039719) TaxID=759272 RepID=G0RY65_CHATD|nr:putative Co-chaperone protein [Thermochaetoides thermophila DSM 1495]EGS23851.1 putative Co-chaperone protein [Thermochaetoides thermophila DSM 1495]